MIPTYSLLGDPRKEFHQKICQNILGHRPGAAVFSNADGDSAASVELAKGMAERMAATFCLAPPTGQGAGAFFTTYTKEFLEASFQLIQHLRPGAWTFGTSQVAEDITAFDQYEHLATLKRILSAHNDLRTAFGDDYFITPDMVVSRSPVSDGEIDAHAPVLGSATAIATHTPLRATNTTGGHPLLHASISCKWTIRSDRSQNTRTEALNLLRNRKGPAPHIVAVILEPLPGRVASIAMGTGDIDCTYHGGISSISRGSWGIVPRGAQS